MARRANLRGALDVCLDMPDHSMVRRSAVEFFGLQDVRNPDAQAARLVASFVTLNRSTLAQLSVTIEQDYDGRDLSLSLRSQGNVGAVPLKSPLTGKLDYGLVVHPRFPWSGIGPMLAEMGWRVTPNPLRLPRLHRSERRVPPWVLSVMVLARMKALLEAIDRRFEIAEEVVSAPRGRVDWTRYATTHLPHAQFLNMPCSFPDLRQDRELLGAIRFTVESTLRSLETQRQHGSFIHRLIQLAQDMLLRVGQVPACRPVPTAVSQWLRRPLQGQQWLDGLEAIEWTTEERGLAGLSELDGIPWVLRMETFFEAWVETILTIVARHTGGLLRTGRKNETTHPLRWEPPYLGSQKSLRPDIQLEWDSTTLIVDAKYKRHWEEMQDHSWNNVEATMREHHREDLLQALAYANLAQAPRVIVCLVYPCSPERWGALRENNRLFHTAEVATGTRVVHLWLTAVPMSSQTQEIATPFIERVHAFAA